MEQELPALGLNDSGTSDLDQRDGLSPPFGDDEPQPREHLSQWSLFSEDPLFYLLKITSFIEAIVRIGFDAFFAYIPHRDAIALLTLYPSR